MRAPQWVTEFFEWRWAPCVGLTAGSLTFVAFALLLIPTHFGEEPRFVSSLSAYESTRPQRTMFNSALARSESPEDDRRAELARNALVGRAVSPPLPRATATGAPAQRGFSPILERPEPPAAPPPPAPPPAAAAPTPTPVVAEAVASAASTAPVTTVPGNVVLIQPEAGGPAREVAP